MSYPPGDLYRRCGSEPFGCATGSPCLGFLERKIVIKTAPKPLRDPAGIPGRRAAMPTLKLHYDGWLSLPAGLRQALGLNSGDRLEAELVDGALVLRPVAKTRRPAPGGEAAVAVAPMPQGRCLSQPMPPRSAASPGGRGRSPPLRASRSPRRRRRAAVRARQCLPATAMRPLPQGPSWDLRSC